MDNNGLQGFPNSMLPWVKTLSSYIQMVEDGDEYSTAWWSKRKDIVSKLKDLLNYVEDRRIDNYIYKSAPGYRGYYESMYNKYFHSNVVDKGLKSSEHRDETWDSYMFRLLNITNKNVDFTAVPQLKDIFFSRSI